jgi:hypothetical protein
VPIFPPSLFALVCRLEEFGLDPEDVEHEAAADIPVSGDPQSVFFDKVNTPILLKDADPAGASTDRKGKGRALEYQTDRWPHDSSNADLTDRKGKGRALEKQDVRWFQETSLERVEITKSRDVIKDVDMEVLDHAGSISGSVFLVTPSFNEPSSPVLTPCTSLLNF